jgi:hypothetical protein
VITDAEWAELLHTRATDPGAVRRAYADRVRRERLLSKRGTLFLVVGRTLLYPPDDDVAAAVEAAGKVLWGTKSGAP